MSENSLQLQPEVWALCHYREGSGGHNAFYGVAKHFAQKTGLNLHAFDLRTVLADFSSAVQLVTNHLPSRFRAYDPSVMQYPRWRMRDLAIAKTASEIVLKPYGAPKAILNSYWSHITNDYFFNEAETVHVPSDTFLANGLDIGAWARFLPGTHKGLTPHNLTAKDLKNEANRFYKPLKGDNKPLIFYVLADALSEPCPADRFKAIASTMPHARFVISSSPRCSSRAFYLVREQLRSVLSPQQLRNLVSYNVHTDPKGENPYKALLTLADHMIVLGESQSMVSERLFAGRTVHYYWSYPKGLIEIYSTLATTGKIRHLAPSNELKTDVFEPIDATAIIAKHLAKDYEEHAVSEPKESAVLNAMQRKILRSLPAVV